MNGNNILSAYNFYASTPDGHPSNALPKGRGASRCMTGRIPGVVPITSSAYCFTRHPR